MKRTIVCVCGLALLLSAGVALLKAEDQPKTDPASKAQAALDKALAYLKTQQKPDGGWQGEKDPPAFTAIVLTSLVGDPAYTTKTDFIKKGYDKLFTYQLENGGIYKDMLANYNTAIAIRAMAAAKDPAFKERIDKAVEYLRTLQWTDKIAGMPTSQPVKDQKDPRFGGFGYGREQRPDGSNTQLAVEALNAAGLKSDDPAYKAALKFITRMQNTSETNDQAWVGNDGGFIYTPANNGESKAGEYEGPGGRRMLRSYGSLTYAGLKSMIYCGVAKDDPRVKAAWNWISKNWTVDENPGLKLGDPAMAKFGLYYYYFTLARALRAYGEPILTDAAGKQHDWRVELIDKLASLQKPDGSFVGEEKWMEGSPILVTSYAAQALEDARDDLKERPARGIAD